MRVMVIRSRASLLLVLNYNFNQSVMKILFISNYWKWVLLVTIGLSSISCSKFLEEEPQNSTFKEVYWKDPKAGETAIAGNYSLLRNALMDGFSGVGNRYYIYGDMTPDIYIGINRIYLRMVRQPIQPVVLRSMRHQILVRSISGANRAIEQIIRLIL